MFLNRSGTWMYSAIYTGLGSISPIWGSAKPAIWTQYPPLGVIQHSYLYLLVRLLVTSWQQVVIMANRLFNVCIYAMIASLGSENMILCIMVVFVLKSFEIWVLRRICLKGDRLFTNSEKKKVWITIFNRMNQPESPSPPASVTV